MKGSDREDIWELGAGLVFASARLEAAREITWTEAQACPADLKATVLLFDCWVHNEDRTLSALGGNPNLLMTAESGEGSKMWVFDFNLAFDADFSVDRFRENHLFSVLLPQWPLGFRERIEPLMKAALDRLDEWFTTMPIQWQHFEGDDSLPVQLDQKLVFETLALAFTCPATFWNRL